MDIPRFGSHIRIVIGCLLSLVLVMAVMRLLTNQEWQRQTVQAEHKADEFLRVSRQFCADRVLERQQVAVLVRDQLQAEADNLAAQAEMQLQTALVEFRSDWLQQQTQAAQENNAALRATLVKTKKSLSELEDKHTRSSSKNKRNGRSDDNETKDGDNNLTEKDNADKTSEKDAVLLPFPELTLDPVELNELSAIPDNKKNRNVSPSSAETKSPSVLEALDQLREIETKTSRFQKKDNSVIESSVMSANTSESDDADADSDEHENDTDDSEDEFAMEPIPAPELPDDWPEKAVRLKNQQLLRILPPSASLEVLSEGRAVVATGQLAIAKASTPVLVVKTVRPMAFKASDTLTRWQIHIRLSADNAELYPLSHTEMVALLNKRLSSFVAIRGFLLDQDGSVSDLFGTDLDSWQGISERTKTGVWIEAGDYAVLHKTEAALSPASWDFAVQSRIPLQTDLSLALMAAGRQPLWYILLLACLLPLGWGLWSAFFSGNSFAALAKQQRLVEAEQVGDGASQTTAVLMPKLGSLMRLQQQHRSASSSSGILDHARSAVLKELARKVRPRPAGMPSSGTSSRSKATGGR